jgi:Ca-activated chloride channel family protein
MDILQTIQFLNPRYFLFLILIPFIVYLFYKKDKQGINFIYLKDLKQVFKSQNYKFYIKIILLILILINFIIILSNPNITNISKKIKKNGIDIVIALDIS